MSNLQISDEDLTKSLVELGRLYSMEFNNLVKTLMDTINNIVEFISNIKTSKNDNALVLEIKDNGVVLLIDKSEIEEIKNNDKPP